MAVANYTKSEKGMATGFIGEETEIILTADGRAIVADMPQSLLPLERALGERIPDGLVHDN